MRWPRRCFLFLPIAAAFLPAAGFPVVAGQPDGSLDLTRSLPGGYAAESGKPMIGGLPEPAPLPGGADRCAAPLPCGTRLRGAIRKDGAVELQVPALRW